MKPYLKAVALALALAFSGSALADRNGSGTYVLPAGNPVNTGTPISSSWANNTLSNIATALTQSIAKDGQTVPTANLPMGGFSHTNVANGTARNHYASIAQSQDFALHVLGSVVGTNTITANLTPAITSYATGMVVVLRPVATNSGGVTLAVNGLGAHAIIRADATNVIAGDLVNGVPALLVHDAGTSWLLLNPQASISGGIAVSDVARLSQSNVFTGNTQQITSSSPAWQLRSSGAAADQKLWRVLSGSTGVFSIDTLTDAGAFGENLLVATRTGTNVDLLTIGGDAMTVTAPTTFTGSGNSGSPIAQGSRGIIGLFENDVTADNGRYRLNADAESLKIELLNDAASTSAVLMQFDRTGNTRDAIAMTSTALTWNGNTLFTTANDGSASGLDADLLDGISVDSFAIRSDSETITNIWAFNGGTSGSTSPFTVDSTTVVTSLNADLLDGQSGSFYQDMGNAAAGTLAVARGGTGTTTSTGTGNVVLSASPTLTGTATVATLAATAATVGGSAVCRADGTNCPAASASADPTATIGATAVNGVATTYMRSDAAPPLPATLPALSGANLTALNAGNISAGTLAVARGGTGTTTSTGTGNVVLSASPTFTGTVTAATVAATTVTGNGSGLTALDAGDISAGTLAIARGGTGQTDGTARNITGKAGVAKTLSTSAASGGSDGDIWYRY